MIGSGYWGKNHVRNFYQLGELSLVCDTTEVGRATAAEIAPGVDIVDDLEPVFRSDAKGVVIATPAETHYTVTKSALISGKDVLVEKPLALTFQEGAELVDLARQLGRVLMVGHVLEYHPAIVRLRELVATGELGRIRYVYSNRLSLGKIRREENALWSLAPHDIAIILRLLGQLPFQVSATGGSYLTPNIADVTVTNLLFDSGVRSHIFVSWLNPFKEQRLVVVGEKKMASFEDVGKSLILYNQRIEYQEGKPVPMKGERISVPFAEDEPLRIECQAFVRAIASRVPPLTNGESGLDVLAVLQAAQRSLIMNGEPVTLPPPGVSPLGAGRLA